MDGLNIGRTWFQKTQHCSTPTSLSHNLAPVISTRHFACSKLNTTANTTSAIHLPTRRHCNETLVCLLCNTKNVPTQRDKTRLRSCHHDGMGQTVLTTHRSEELQTTMFSSPLCILPRKCVLCSVCAVYCCVLCAVCKKKN